MAHCRRGTGGSSDFNFNFPSPRPDAFALNWDQTLDFGSSNTSPPPRLASSGSAFGQKQEVNRLAVGNPSNFNFSLAPARRVSATGDGFSHAPIPFSPTPPSRFGLGLSEHNALARFYNDQEQPWAPIVNASAPAEIQFAPSQTSPANFNVQTYRSGPQSELESIETGVYQSDSGYHTHSIRSAGAPDCSQELTQEFSEQFSNTFNPAALNMPPIEAAGSNPHDAQQGSEPASSRLKAPLQTCKVCGEVPKCPSDFKKHMLKHDKPHHCTVEGCSRLEGYRTMNDLIRHQKSLHKMHLVTTKSYKCASHTCRHPNKIWPRLDNFKQHVGRMHKGEDMQLLIDQSEIKGPPLSGLSMDNTLAGMDPAARYQEEESFVSPASLATQPDASPLTQAFVRDPSLSRMEIDHDQSRPEARLEPDAVQQIESRHSSVYSLLSPPVSLRTQSASSGPTGFSSASDNLTTLAEAAVADAIQRSSASAREATTFPQIPHVERSIIEQITTQGELSGGLSSIAVFLAAKVRRDGMDSLEATLLNALQELIQHNAFQMQGPRAGASSVTVKGTDSDHSPRPQTQAEGSSSEESGVDVESERKGRRLLAPLAIRKKPMKQCLHPGCGRLLKRTCDLNKHMKRHTRPYGCTFRDCSKTFGSKNDWKRHENSLHCQIELYRCQIPDLASAARPCAEVFYTAEDFASHLRRRHKCSDEVVPDRVKEARIGRNNQTRFWCGFCRQIIELQGQGVKGWDERFNHIDEHFKRGEKIDEWVDVEENKTKKEMWLSASKKRKASAAEDGWGADAKEPDDNDVGISVLGGPHGSSSSNSPVPSPASSAEASERAMKKRKLSADKRPEPKKTEQVKFCCQCRDGPTLLRLNEKCLNCGHYCSSCPVETQLAVE